MRDEQVIHNGQTAMSEQKDRMRFIAPLVTTVKKPAVAGRLIFSDEEHHELTLSRLNTMRKEEHFCDATLEIGGHNIPVHRAVLAACSVYLFELFSPKEEARAKHHFKLEKNLDYASVEVLVNYAYTSRFVLTVVIAHFSVFFNLLDAKLFFAKLL